MHKGKITMLGRIMAGSQAVIAHDDAGQAVFVAYYPPDIHLSQVIVAYCQQVAVGNRERPVCHRPGGQSRWPWPRRLTSRAWACCACSMTTSMRVWRALRPPMVDTLEDGTRVYSGPWKESRTR